MGRTFRISAAGQQARNISHAQLNAVLRNGDVKEPGPNSTATFFQPVVINAFDTFFEVVLHIYLLALPSGIRLKSR